LSIGLFWNDKISNPGGKVTVGERRVMLLLARLSVVRCGRKISGSAPVSALNDRSNIVKESANVGLANIVSRFMLRF
jgi:hypothetical protein